jgi:hypothetical protein
MAAHRDGRDPAVPEPERVTLDQVAAALGAVVDDPDDKRDKISLDEIAKNAGADEPATRLKLGKELLIWIVPFLGLAFLLFAAFAAWTYPHLSEFTGLTGCGVDSTAAGPASDAVTCQASPLPGSEAVKLWGAARAEWVTQTKDLGQLFIISPLIPLFATAVGYMVGQRDR